MNIYTFYWLTSKREVLQGTDQADALNKAGYGNGAIRALDFWASGDNKDYFWDKDNKKWEWTPEAYQRIFGTDKRKSM